MREGMRSKRSLRASWVVTVGTSAIVGACGGTTAGDPSGDGGSTDGGTYEGGNPPGCPSAPPTVGGACPIPSQRCDYGSMCSPLIYTCTGGAWIAVHGNPPAPACPTSPPSGACPCYPTNFQCSYPNGTCNGMPIQEIAQCSNGQWVLSVSTCNPPAPDAGHDSGFVDASTDAPHD